MPTPWFSPRWWATRARRRARGRSQARGSTAAEQRQPSCAIASPPGPSATLRKSVVPILVQNLARGADAGGPASSWVAALAELGPARPGKLCLSLEECLQKAKSPQERAVVLRALGEMGPAGWGAGRRRRVMVTAMIESLPP